MHSGDRDAFLDSHASRYLPRNRAAWAMEYDRDPVATRRTLGAAPELTPEARASEHGAEDATLESVLASPQYQRWQF